mmetsp:Transcript_15993/g.28141  ORF Transcript_15993/g.28141 Transcript_15993/m.28141 type:complete len:82 (+) Transcript_15993:176-421(+)
MAPKEKEKHQHEITMGDRMGKVVGKMRKQKLCVTKMLLGAAGGNATLDEDNQGEGSMHDVGRDGTCEVVMHGTLPQQDKRR